MGEAEIMEIRRAAVAPEILENCMMTDVYSRDFGFRKLSCLLGMIEKYLKNQSKDRPRLESKKSEL